MRERFNHYCRNNGFEFGEDRLINEVDYCGIKFFGKLDHADWKRYPFVDKGFKQYFKDSQLDGNQAIVGFVVQDKNKILILDSVDALIGLPYPKVVALWFMFEAIEISA